MSSRQRWFSKRLDALRHGASRGATLVEYALVLSLLVVGGLASYEYLSDAAEAEVENQADCVSDRPPPGDCSFAPVPPDVVHPDPNVGPPPTWAPAPSFDHYTIEAHSSDAEDDPWTLILPVTVFVEVTEPPTDPEGTPGIRVRARIQMRDPDNPGQNLPDPGFTECVTDAFGDCDLRYTVPFPDVEEATMVILGVDAPNPPDDLPSMRTFQRGAS